VVILSFTSVTATHGLVCESKCGVPKACIVWISLKTLCLQVLASFADATLLDFSLRNTQRSIYTYSHEQYVYALYGMYIVRITKPMVPARGVILVILRVSSIFFCFHTSCYIPGLY
jgi:hypothetical protein